MRRISVFCLVFAIAPAASAADVVKPAEVTGMTASRNGADVDLSWSAVTQSASGGTETVAEYRIYRGATPGFVPDLVGGSNRVGTSPGTTFVDVGEAGAPGDAYYLVTASDAAGNESAPGPSDASVAPILSSGWTDASIELTWSGAGPAGSIAGYRVYTGPKPHEYDTVMDVGSATNLSLTGLTALQAYYAAVVAYDGNGVEGPFSNEIVEGVAGRIRVRAQNGDYLCWGASKCPPPAGTVQRNDGWQLNVPVDLPPGDWTKISASYTIDSRLCTEGQNQTTSRCGSGNPCLYPPCNGGYNPCGDPWDRTAHLFLVLDEACLTNGSSCINPSNLELMRAVTPFGTDAPAPLGRGITPPRVLTLDVTPYRSLLSGHRWVGTEIGHFVQSGWHVTVDFNFSKRPEEASPKKPADGVQIVYFGGAPMATPTPVSIPSDAQKVVMRLFTTGHGGTQYCDGGSNDGASCTSSSNCPGGSCQNCDEFCHRTNRILRDGSPIWTGVPFRTDCSPGGITDCQNWNSCGWPSCVFSRAGWCPGYIACTGNAPCDQDIDMTSQLLPGSTHGIGYDVLVQRGSWTVSMAVFWYRTP